MEIENLFSQEGTKNNNSEQGETLDKEIKKLTEQEQEDQGSLEKSESDEKKDSTEQEDHKGKKKHKKISEKEYETLQHEVAELKDKYLRLYSEFENFKRRTAKEKLELIRTASEEVLASLLPIIDDFERAITSMPVDINGNPTYSEGFLIIYNKLKYISEKKGLKVMNIEIGSDFNAEMHEAITKIPVEDEKLKGKIVEVLEKGYYLHEKVIRFAKVVTGS